MPPHKCFTGSGESTSQFQALTCVLTSFSYNGLNYTLSIFIADTSSLKNRSFIFAFSNSPYIITTWIGGPLAAAFYNKVGFRWGFGAFAIITPIVHAPLIALFTWNYHKAKRTGLITHKSSDRTVSQSVRHCFLEFDLVGLLLICSGLALLLLPFSLSTYQANGWKSPMIICMIVFGVALTIVRRQHLQHWLVLLGSDHRPGHPLHWPI